MKILVIMSFVLSMWGGYIASIHASDQDYEEKSNDVSKRKRSNDAEKRLEELTQRAEQLQLRLAELEQRGEGTKSSTDTIKKSLYQVMNEELALEDFITSMNGFNVYTLDLSNSQIDDRGAAAIAQALLSNTTIKVLNLKHNRITDTGALALLEALKFNNTLVSVDLHRQHMNGQTNIMGTLLTHTSLQHYHKFKDEKPSLKVTLFLGEYNCQECSDEKK